MISELEYDWKIQSKHMVFSIQPVGLAIHSTYFWNIKWKKCACMGLNGFHIKWIIGTHRNWKNQNSGSRFGAAS